MINFRGRFLVGCIASITAISLYFYVGVLFNNVMSRSIYPDLLKLDLLQIKIVWLLVLISGVTTGLGGWKFIDFVYEFLKKY
jgi:hypothetical protein